MKKLLLICLMLISTSTFAQDQFWKKFVTGSIPNGLKESNATLVFIIFSDADIKNLELHSEYTTTIYNKYVKLYANKYFTGQIEFMSMADFMAKKNEVDYVFLPLLYNVRLEGIVPGSFGVVDIKEESAYTRHDMTGEDVTVGSMKSEILLEMKLIKKQRDGK